MVSAFTEDHSVKCTVDDIPQCTCQNKGDAEHQSERLFPSGNSYKVPTNSNYSNDPENTEDDLSKIATEFHAEGHPFIFCKMEDEPVTDHVNFAS